MAGAFCAGWIEVDHNNSSDFSESESIGSLKNVLRGIKNVSVVLPHSFVKQLWGRGECY